MINANVKNINKICFLLVTHTGIIKINKIIIVIGQIIIWIGVFMILAINKFEYLGKKLLVININQTKNKNDEVIVKIILLINKIRFSLIFFSILFTNTINKIYYILFKILIILKFNLEVLYYKYTKYFRK